MSSTNIGGLLIKWGGPWPACRVPSADTFTPTNLHWLTLRWQILDTSCAREAFQPILILTRFLLYATSGQQKWLWKLNFNIHRQQSVNIKGLCKVSFGHCSMMSLQRGSFWDNWVIQTGSSGYQLHSGEQRARSGTNHTTWPHALCVCERECVCVFHKGRQL